MKISSIKITNFRCFGPEGVVVSLDNTTALIGANSSGKTAVLLALFKLFEFNRGLAQIEKSDFHISPGEENADIRTLEIEARFEFPGLEEDDFDEPDPSIPAFINQILIDSAEDVPHCILRLNATWSREENPEGNIEFELNWIISPEGTPVEEERRSPATKGLRPRVSVIYVPANRDPSQQVKHTAGSVLHRLFRCIRWSEKLQNELDEVANKIDETFADEQSVKKIRSMINKSWTLLHGDKLYGEVDFQPFNPEINEFLRGISTVFYPNEEDESTNVSFLSDGMRSLFYLTLIMSMSEIDNKSLEERKAAWLRDDSSDEEGEEDETEERKNDDIEIEEQLLGDLIDLEKLSSPLLTILAIEEPENHLSPHYLGKIMEGLNELAEKPCAQVVLTSHSPSILSRVEPENVRYLRHDMTKRTSYIRNIPIPDSEVEAAKFIREAVQTYPELYFARCVILGEGASEEIVLRKILRLYGLSSDRQFISIVPLGGRHINHLWRLLAALYIPFFTLIDLDLGREFGGVARFKFIAKELKIIGKPLMHKRPRESDGVMIKVRTKIPDALNDRKKITRWIKKFRSKKIFFSAPLDLDLSLLSSYQNAYENIEIRGPEIPESDDADYQDKLDIVTQAVLGMNGDSELYYQEEIDLFWRYRYHFLTKSKPSSHLRALNTLSDDELRETCPENLKRLVNAIADELDFELIGDSE